MKLWLALGAGTLAAALLAGCGGDSDNDPVPSTDTAVSGVKLNFMGRYSTGQFDESAAEIPAYDAGTQRLFVVNAQKGALDVLGMDDPANPALVDTLTTSDIAVGTEVNSVAVRDGLVAVAVQAPLKTDAGYLALYDAETLERISFVTVGALPDMVAFTADGQFVLTANEGEPSDDYSVDPEGSVSVVDISDPRNPVVATADFTAFNGQEDDLRDQGVRIFGPGASTAQDLEPEYIALDRRLPHRQQRRPGDVHRRRRAGPGRRPHHVRHPLRLRRPLVLDLGCRGRPGVGFRRRHRTVHRQR